MGVVGKTESPKIRMNTVALTMTRMMKQKPKIHQIQTLAETRIFRIEGLALEFSNGATAEYQRVTSNAQGAVLIVPMLDDETFLLISEYAAGTEAYELGFPKGGLEQGEDILEAANRELMEECGYAAGELTELREIAIAPGYIRHRTHVVLATGLYAKSLQGDEPEALETVPWRLDNLAELLQHPDFNDARSMAALLMLQERNRR